MIGDFPYDFGGDAGGGADALMIIGAIGEEFLDEGKDGPRSLRHRLAGVAVRHTGRVRFEQQAAVVGIDKGMALAALDLLARRIPVDRRLRPSSRFDYR